MSKCDPVDCVDPKRDIILQNGVSGPHSIEFYNSEGELGGTIYLGDDGITITPGGGLMSELGLGTIATEDAGWTGSFTNGDGATVTVVNGIITAVAPP